MYHRAAKLGCTTSQTSLAEMYRCGVEGVVNEDLNEAFKWFKIAAGESVGDFNKDLGEYERLRFGTISKLGDAISGKKQKALRLLYKYYLEGDCPEGRPQPTKAVYYLTKAAEQGDTEAQRELGQIYLSGSCEQVKDIAKARRWLGKACCNGDIRAKQLLQKCEQIDDTHCAAPEPKKEAFTQSFEILMERWKQISEANQHPFAITKPVAFSEELLSEFKWSRTARIYLQAFKLVKEGFEILCKSNFTNVRGIHLIARGYLTENSILQAFPQIKLKLPEIFKLCEKNLLNNPCFFESLVLAFAFRCYEIKLSNENGKIDKKKVMCMKNLIHFIQKAEPNRLPADNPFKFDETYSSWLHVLYDHLASMYIITDAYEAAAEAFENSLKCCPSYFPSKRGLGYCLLSLYSSRVHSERQESGQDVHVPKEFHLLKKQMEEDKEISKYASWTTEVLGVTAEKILNEFLAEAPPCWKTYPNVCYYLAKLALVNDDMKELKRYYELGQDAEEKRLPFFDPVNIPLKDLASQAYQLHTSLPEPIKCGNKACRRKVKETELKFCGGCRVQKYCSKDCQKSDWKKHKATCNASKGHKTKSGT